MLNRIVSTSLVFFLCICPILSAEEIEFGPVVTDPDRTPTILEEEAPRSIDPGLLQNIDLEKTPWLCERVGLPAAHPVFTRPKSIWADSLQFVPLNEVLEDDIVVERWVNAPPENLAGKYVLIEVWATWCPPCHRGLPLLNYFHDKYKDDLVVVSICETDEEALKTMKGPLTLEDVRFSLAVDTNRRFANKLGVFGIPHAVLLEPTVGAVIWEGMPTLPGHELDEAIMEKVLAIGKKLKEAGKMPEQAPIAFRTEKADPEKVPKPKGDRKAEPSKP
ncbi:MAG: TlpA family protein disulfide reductase [Thermoguttaceae bacterium]